jgi:hypothetical protein
MTMVDVKEMTTGVVVILIGTFVFYLLFATLFPTVNTSVTTLGSQLTGGGYTDVTNIVNAGFKILLIALGLSPLAIGVALIVDAFKHKGK